MTAAADHVARSTADRALMRIEAHEKQCTERWEQSRAAHNDLKSSLLIGFRWMFGMLLTGMGTVILLLISIVTGSPHK